MPIANRRYAHTIYFTKGDRYQSQNSLSVKKAVHIVLAFNVQRSRVRRRRLLINPGAILAHAPFRRRARRHCALRLITSVMQQKSDDSMRRDALCREVSNRSAIICVGPEILQSSRTNNGRSQRTAGHFRLRDSSIERRN